MPLGSLFRPIRLQRGSGSARRAARRSLSGEGPGGFFSCRCLILPLVARFPSSRFPPGEFLLPDPRSREGFLTSAVIRGGRIRRGAVRTPHLSPWQSVEQLPTRSPKPTQNCQRARCMAAGMNLVSACSVRGRAGVPRRRAGRKTGRKREGLGSLRPPASSVCMEVYPGEVGT
ncbi:hypothetical protein Nmel_005646 [Mimus melanotis]